MGGTADVDDVRIGDGMYLSVAVINVFWSPKWGATKSCIGLLMGKIQVGEAADLGSQLLD